MVANLALGIFALSYYSANLYALDVTQADDIDV